VFRDPLHELPARPAWRRRRRSAISTASISATAPCLQRTAAIAAYRWPGGLHWRSPSNPSAHLLPAAVASLPPHALRRQGRSAGRARLRRGGGADLRQGTWRSCRQRTSSPTYWSTVWLPPMSWSATTSITAGRAPARRETLIEEGRRHGFSKSPSWPPARHGETLFSSSEVRSLASRGPGRTRLPKFSAMTGSRGEVIGGARRGRDLGFPTANLKLSDNCELRHGVYAVRARIDGAEHAGVASFGRRPQFDNGAPLARGACLRFRSGDLYGRVDRSRLHRLPA
jgi:hypothetical protein